MLEQILADLYASEINASLSWFWDAGFHDEMNGYLAEAQVSMLHQAAEWLRDNAVRLYPDSDFAKKYSAGVGILRAARRGLNPGP